MKQKSLTRAELQADNEALRAALIRVTDQLNRLTPGPLPWTLHIDGEYLQVRLSFDEARAWGKVLGQGQFARQHPGCPIAVVTA